MAYNFKEYMERPDRLTAGIECVQDAVRPSHFATY